MPTVANLAVSVTAKTSKFNRKMKQAGKNVREFGRKVANVGKRLAQFGALTGGAAVAGLTVMTRQSFKLIDATSKLASTFGIATDQLIGLQHGAVIMGGTVEGMGKALKEFVRRLGEASTRTGEMRDAVRMLGLDEAALVAMGTADAMKAVFDRIALLPDAFQQAEAAYRIFGRQGTVFIKLMRVGSKGVDEFVREVQAMGLTFTELESIGVQNANDALFRLRQTMRGTANQIALQLQPIVGSLATSLVDMAIEGDGVRSRVNAAFTAMEKAAGHFANSLKIVETAWFALQGTVLLVTKTTIDAFSQLVTGSMKWRALLSVGILDYLGLVSDATEVARQLTEESMTPRVKALQQWSKTISETLSVDIEQAALRMDKALEAFTKGTAARRLATWLDDVRDKWDELAKRTELRAPEVTKPLIPFEQLRGGAAARARRTEFQEVSLARMAVQGVGTLSRPQVVRDPQLEKTNEHLRLLRAAIAVQFGLTS